MELRDERGSLAAYAQLDADARVLNAFTPVLLRTLTKTCHGMVDRDPLMKDLFSMKVVLYDSTPNVTAHDGGLWPDIRPSPDEIPSLSAARVPFICRSRPETHDISPRNT